jgi:methylglutaconyl-CoA hydratase
MSYQFLEVERRGPVEYVALNRPDVRNAFNDGVIAELTAWAAAAAASSPDLRVVVLSGRGKVFSAGADLKWMSQALAKSRAETREEAAALARLLRALDELPQAVVGRIHGAAIAGGTGLTAVCDIAVASEDTMFGFSETRLGIVPAMISPYVVAKIGRSAARELFLTGARFGAARAREIGLVHAVVAPDRLDETVDGYVRELLQAGPAAVAAAKALIREVAGRPPADLADVTSDFIADRRASAEGRAGITAFLEKRPPPWAGGKPGS